MTGPRTMLPSRACFCHGNAALRSKHLAYSCAAATRNNASKINVLKASHFIAPALTSALVLCGLASQRHAILRVEQRTGGMRQRIESTCSTATRHTDIVRRLPGMETAQDKPIDWKKLAMNMNDMRSGNGGRDLRALLRVQKRLLSMSGPELSSVIEGIAGLGLAPEDGHHLRAMLLEVLAAKDPALAMRNLIEPSDHNSDVNERQITGCFQQWLKLNTAAAADWLDRQIAAGTLEDKSIDGTNPLRLNLETALFSTMLSSDAEAAGLRLVALPQDQRRSILESAFDLLEPGSEIAFANAARAFLPQSDFAGMLSGKMEWIAAHGGSEYVDRFLDTIAATPAERQAAAGRGADGMLEGSMRDSMLDPAAEEYEYVTSAGSP